MRKTRYITNKYASLFKFDMATKFDMVGRITGFVHVGKSEIQGLFKDFQGHLLGNPRTNGQKRRL